MLDKKRIQEAQSNVRNYLADGLMKKVAMKDQVATKILLNNSHESLKIAELLDKDNHSNLWTIVTSYYAMYYIAKAVLYEFGYKVGEQISHKVTADALIVCVMPKLTASLLAEYEEAKEEALELSGNKAHEMIESFDLERDKRSRFQYSITEVVLKSKAQTSLARAKKFIAEIEKLLNAPTREKQKG